MRKTLLLFLLFGLVISGCGKKKSTPPPPAPSEGWTLQETGIADTSFYGISFVDLQIGWAVGEYGTIIHTTDGGKSWSLQTSGTNYWLCDVKFVSPNLGWAVGQNGTILHTLDGGATWIDGSDPQLTTERLWRCSFPDALNGWATGDAGTIIHTNDGGESWTKQDLNHLPGSATWWLKGVYFRDQLEGWVSGKFGVILHTTDGGGSWNQQNSETKMNLNGIIFPENNLEGWAGGKNGEIIHTTDGGKTWEQQCKDSTSYCLMGGVYSTDNQHGWGVGKWGRIVSTKDGGVTWEIEDTGLTYEPHLLGLDAVKEGNLIKVWVAGGQGTILCSEVGL